MDNFSDDEKTYEVESIIDQRKRKGVLEYLVQWKEAGPEEVTWEPAESIAASCAQLIKAFLTEKKQKRSASKSRKSSRSKSRSSSRSRKATEKTTRKTSTRSRSRGRASKKQVEESKLSEEIIEEKKSEPLEGKSEIVETNNTSKLTTPIISAATTSSVSVATSSSNSTISQKVVKEKKETDTPLVQGRVLRSSTMAAREKLEVQRVHNEQRPVHKDDNKPRSSVWKVADYVVIVLFILSVIAALFLFLEKFLDLEDFKKQAFPSMGLLKERLAAGQQNFLDIVQYAVDQVSSGWTVLVNTIAGGTHKEPVSAA